MIISEISQGESFRKSCLIENTEQVMIRQSSYTSPTCYTLTDIDFTGMSFRDDYFLITTEPPLYTFDNQLNLISLSRAMFKNARQLEGRELSTLNKAFSKGFSDKPTRL
jgi:hypothetical protein